MIKLENIIKVKVGDGFSREEYNSLDTSTLLDNLVSSLTDYIAENNFNIESACNLGHEKSVLKDVKDMIKDDYLNTIYKITNNGEYDYDIIDFAENYEDYIKDLDKKYEDYGNEQMDEWNNENNEQQKEYNRSRL